MSARHLAKLCSGLIDFGLAYPTHRVGANLKSGIVIASVAVAALIAGVAIALTTFGAFDRAGTHGA